MSDRRIVLTREAGVQLDSLLDYIAEAASPGIAVGFADQIFEGVVRLEIFPNLGVAREDIRPGLRILSLRKRVTVAFVADASAVLIVGIFYGGQDFQTILRQDDEA